MLCVYSYVCFCFPLLSHRHRRQHTYTHAGRQTLTHTAGTHGHTDRTHKNKQQAPKLHSERKVVHENRQYTASFMPKTNWTVCVCGCGDRDRAQAPLKISCKPSAPHCQRRSIQSQAVNRRLFGSVSLLCGACNFFAIVVRDNRIRTEATRVS